MLRGGWGALWLAMLAAGCGGSGAPTSPAQPPLKVYRHSEDGAPTTLDPAQSSSVYSNFVVRNVYDTLYAYKYLQRPYALKPNLAAAMPEVTPDGLTYVIRLKPGARYTDDAAFADGRGREVVAQDFVYSIQRHFDPDARSQGAWLWQNRIAGLEAWKAAGADYDQPVEGLRALDAHTIQIRLTRPFPQFAYTLALGYAALVPREAVSKYGRELALHPVGSGPFRLLSFDTARAVLERNPNYRREPLNLVAEGYDEAQHGDLGLKALDGRTPPFVDRVQIDWVQEPTARWASFTKKSEVQYTLLPAEQFNAVLGLREPLLLKPEYARKYHSRAATEAGLAFEVFNLEDPEIGLADDPERNRRNRELRCAIAEGYDWDARNRRYYGGLASVYQGVITPAMPEFDSSLTAPGKGDVAAARQRLADAGWTAQNLPTIEEGLPAGPLHSEMHEQFRGLLLDLGWPADKLRSRSHAAFGDYVQAYKTRQLQVFPLGWNLDYPDAENTLALFYGPNRSPGSNFSNYRNADYDRLYDQAAVLPPGEARTGLYRRMNRMLIDDCVGLYALSRKRVYLWHRAVRALPDREINNGFWLKYVDVDS